ncbi:hypothetical protein KA405_02355 [Patescibacteria group bacterium]|nr:hypothetical protein [Patescibacteria group bacterium]
MDINQSMPLTIVPVGIDKKKHDDEAVTFNVKYQEDIKQRRATAKSPA